MISSFTPSKANEVRKIEGYGSAGNFVAAIKYNLYFFGLSQPKKIWSQIGQKIDAHSQNINMLAAVSASILVTGDDDGKGYFKTWDISNVASITQLGNTGELGAKVKDGCAGTYPFVYIVGENKRLAKYDIAHNLHIDYGSKINVAIIHRSSVLIGLENNQITSFQN